MKKLLHIAFLFTLPVAVAALAACGGRCAALPVLDLEAAIIAGRSLPDTFTLGDIVEVVDIIPIETRSDALMGNATVIHIGREHLYVRHDNAVSRVDRNGKIVNTIARQGRGPGEYLYLNHAVVIEESSTIRVHDMNGGKYLVYNVEGDLLEEGSLRETGTILFVGDDYMVMRGSDNAAHRLLITDGGMNIRQGIFPMDSTLSRSERFNLTQQVNVAHGGDGALVNLAAEDTLYRVTRRGATPEAILKKGRYRRPEELYVFDPGSIDPNNPTIMTSSVGEFGPGHYLVNYILDTGLAMQLLDRDGRVAAHTDNRNGFDKYGFRFVFPSGSEARVSTLFTDGDVAAFTLNALDAAGWVEGVAEDDNPVVVVAKIR